MRICTPCCYTRTFQLQWGGQCAQGVADTTTVHITGPNGFDTTITNLRPNTTPTNVVVPYSGNYTFNKSASFLSPPDVGNMGTPNPSGAFMPNVPPNQTVQVGCGANYTNYGCQCNGGPDGQGQCWRGPFDYTPIHNDLIFNDGLGPVVVSANSNNRSCNSFTWNGCVMRSAPGVDYNCKLAQVANVPVCLGVTCGVGGFGAVVQAPSCSWVNPTTLLREAKLQDGFDCNGNTIAGSSASIPVRAADSCYPFSWSGSTPIDPANPLYQLYGGVLSVTVTQP
jgi:hypothetical protein